jgi:hypothetical protein
MAPTVGEQLLADFLCPDVSEIPSLPEEGKDGFTSCSRFLSQIVSC